MNSSTWSEQMTSSCRSAGYEADDRWAKLLPGHSWSEATAVAVDSKDQVYVFNRGRHPVMVFNREGTFLRCWGEGLFVRPHGITIAPDDNLFLTDDSGHVVYKFTPEGRLLMTLGTPGKPSDTGATSIDFRTIRRSADPFYYPTNVAIAANRDLYITDGYGNARVHHFTPDGQLLHSWGEPGSGPGQFHVPHGIAIDSEGTVYVADRENSRIQLFSPKGEYLREWGNLARPAQLAIVGNRFYVAELGYRAGMWPGTHPPTPDATGGRVSIRDRTGNVLSWWGGGENPTAPGDFFAPHDIAVDSHGDIYVAEVTMSAGGNRGLVSPDCHSLQKFSSPPT
jgi:DNA-binding beta-propeller fold protein YncE